MKNALIFVVAVFATQYAKVCFGSLDVARAFLNGETLRPYAYRVLVPWIAKTLSFSGLREDWSLTLVIVAFAVGTAYSIAYLLDGNVLVGSAATIVFMGLFSYQAKVYDISTVLFFALGMGLLKNKKLQWFMVMFPFACLNRETAFLLTILYAILYVKQIKAAEYIFYGIYQVTWFLLVRMLVVFVYWGNPGVDAMVRPLENIRLFVYYPIQTVLHVLVFAAIFWMFRRIKATHFLKTAFWVLVPISLVNYIVLGWSFEIRVFAEIFPLVALVVYQYIGEIHENHIQRDIQEAISENFGASKRNAQQTH